METAKTKKSAGKSDGSQRSGILPNLGPVSRAWLSEIGIVDDAEIRALGAVETYCRLRFRFGNKVSRNMLHALAAGLIGIRWTELSPEHKADLDAAVERRMAQPDAE